MSEGSQQPDEQGIVRYEAADGIAWITMNRPEYHNAQNGKMTYLLDDCLLYTSPSPRDGLLSRMPSSA